MGEDAQRFRRRARQCRELAPRARDEQIRLYLIEVACDLEAEADKVDGLEAEMLEREAARREKGDAEPLG